MASTKALCVESSLFVIAAFLSLSVVCGHSCKHPYPDPPSNNQTRAIPTGVVSNVFDLLNGLAAQKYIVLVSYAVP